jgi:hypothetical protein
MWRRDGAAGAPWYRSGSLDRLDVACCCRRRRFAALRHHRRNRAHYKRRPADATGPVSHSRLVVRSQVLTWANCPDTLVPSTARATGRRAPATRMGNEASRQGGGPPPSPGGGPPGPGAHGGPGGPAAAAKPPPLPPQYTLRVIVRGMRKTGKTSLVARLQGKAIPAEYAPTPEIQVRRSRGLFGGCGLWRRAALRGCAPAAGATHRLCARGRTVTHIPAHSHEYCKLCFSSSSPARVPLQTGGFTWTYKNTDDRIRIEVWDTVDRIWDDEKTLGAVADDDAPAGEPRGGGGADAVAGDDASRCRPPHTHLTPALCFPLRSTPTRARPRRPGPRSRVVVLLLALRVVQAGRGPH